MKRSIRAMLLFVVLLSVMLTGCMGPIKKEVLIEIKPNESAYVIPLEGDTGEQAKFQSIEYLESVKIATKRISLPQRKLKKGRGSWNFRWIPTAVVVKVDRAPISREWTEENETGTQARNQSIMVETSNSIGFGLGVSITAMIKEENTSKFLYLYSGKQLTDIIDTNVRNRASDLLAQEFGRLDLDECRLKKGDIFTKVKAILQEEFIEFGITITQFGLIGGLVYDNEEIQAKIDQEFTAKNMVKINEYDFEANEIKRKDARKQAENELYVAQKYAQALKANEQKTLLAIQQTYADAFKIAAEKGNAVVPSNIVPEGSNFLYTPNLGK